MELNLIPFLAEALSYNKNIYKDIDALYVTNKFIFYENAVKSEFYNCNIANERSLIEDEYFKKSVGLLETCIKNNDEYLNNDICRLFEKGFKTTFNYFKNKTKADFNEYGEFLKNSFDSMSDDEINANICSAIFFSTFMDEVDNIDGVLELLLLRLQHYNGNNRFSYKNATKEIKSEVRKLKSLLDENIAKYVFSTDPDYESAYSFLYDSENISQISLFQELKFNENDMNEILMSYWCGKKQYGLRMRLNDYVIPAIHIKCMLKAYKKVKEMYFANNKETMYLELKIKENKIKDIQLLLDKTKEKTKQLINKNKTDSKELIKENDSLKKEVQKLQQELQKREDNTKEVIALRDFIFSMSYSENHSFIDDVECNIESIKNKNVTIIGGHPKLQQKLKELFPDWKYISIDINILDEAIIYNSDFVIFNINYLSHKLYYKIINIITNTEIKIGYIENRNIDIICKEIHNIINK